MCVPWASNATFNGVSSVGGECRPRSPTSPASFPFHRPTLLGGEDFPDAASVRPYFMIAQDLLLYVAWMTSQFEGHRAWP